MLGRLAGMVPGAGARKRGARTSGGAKATAPAGLALLAGAAGMAFKNRDKLIGLLPGRSRQEESPPAPPAVETSTVEHLPESAASEGPGPPATGLDVAGTPPPDDIPPPAPPPSTSP